MVQVQKRTLRAFEEHSLSPVDLGIQIGRDVRKKRHYVLGDFQVSVSQCHRVEGGAPKQRRGNTVLLCNDFAAPAAEQFRVAKIARSEPAATSAATVAPASRAAATR